MRKNVTTPNGLLLKDYMKEMDENRRKHSNHGISMSRVRPDEYADFVEENNQIRKKYGMC